jgi:hypothetical protein
MLGGTLTRALGDIAIESNPPQPIGANHVIGELNTKVNTCARAKPLSSLVAANDGLPPGFSNQHCKRITCCDSH